MKKNSVNILLILFVLFVFTPLRSQSKKEYIEGYVSFLTSQNVYAKFHSTEQIHIGDTLYIVMSEKLIPVMEVNHVSSISCVGPRMPGIEIQINEPILAIVSITDSTDINVSDITGRSALDTVRQKVRPVRKKRDKVNKNNGKDIFGKFAVSSYSSFSNSEGNNFQAMKHTFSLETENFHQSGFSSETYITFRHKSNEWYKVRENLGQALKVYSLSLQYDLDESTHVSFGRKINYRISNIGAIDGLQIEKSIKSNFILGAIAGSRPDYEDYSVNFDLFQMGAYFGYKMQNKNSYMENYLAVVEQKNSMKTDRRFAYFQHNSSLHKNFSIFSSFEIDLYKKENGTPTSTLNMTSAYVSLRYRFNRQLSVFGSYDARKNVIYYETFKNDIDQLIENETRQGFRLSIQYRPIKYLSMGASSGYRFQKSDVKPSKNLRVYVNYGKIPIVGVSSSLTYTLIETNFLDSKIYGLRFSRDFLKGRVYAGINLQQAMNYYTYSDNSLIQNIIGASISCRLTDQLSLSVDYEDTIERELNYNRVYANLILRY